MVLRLNEKKKHFEDLVYWKKQEFPFENAINRYIN